MTSKKFSLLFDWLQQKGFEEEIDILCESVLMYLPGYTIDEDNKDPSYTNRLISYCKSTTSPYKIYGVCLFIYTIIDNSFKVFDIADELGVDERSQLLANPKFKLRKSWDELVEAGFNPDCFFDDLFQSIEHTFYGESKRKYESD